MSKFRSSLDFAAQYASNKQGISSSIENFVHLKEESVAGTFTAPSVGTQGVSTSDATPSVDISASSNRNGKVAVDGASVVNWSLSVVTGLTSGALVAAAIETAMNTALSTAGQDGRVWAEYTSGTYRFHSQKTGATSAVVITAGSSLDLTAELKVGTGNAGVEAVGTYGGDFLKMTKASLKVAQGFEMSEHKSGRQASNIIKKKKMADGDVEAYVNVATGGSATVDTPMSLLLEAAMGAKIVAGSSIKFDASQPPVKYVSAVQGNNVFARYFNGAYPKNLTISLPGDGEAKLKFSVKARDGKYAAPMQINGAVAGSAAVIVNNGESTNVNIGARVMVVGADGRTVTAGQDGSITILTRTDGAHTVGLSTTVTAEDNGFLVPWMPHCFDQHGTDNPVTGLEGTVSFDGGSTTVEEIRSVEYTFDPKVTDFDDWYGQSTNMGRAVGDRCEIGVKVELVLTAAQIRKVVESSELKTISMQTVLGPAAGRRVKFSTPKVYFEIPPIEIPDNGVATLVLQGKAVQSADGALDAFTMEYL